MTRQDIAQHVREVYSKTALQAGMGYPALAFFFRAAGRGMAVVELTRIIRNKPEMVAPAVAEIAIKANAEVVGICIPSRGTIGDDPEEREFLFVSGIDRDGATCLGADVMRPDTEPPFLADWRDFEATAVPWVNQTIAALKRKQN